MITMKALLLLLSVVALSATAIGEVGGEKVAEVAKLEAVADTEVAEVAQLEAVADTEVAEGEVAEGEVAEGEVAEGEVAEGEVAEGEVAGLQEERQSRSFCPSGWLPHNSYCYFVNKRYMTWFDAKDFCNKKGGHLASGADLEENEFMQNLLTITDQTAAWIGGFYLQSEWLWLGRQRFLDEDNLEQICSVRYCPCMYLQRIGGWRNARCSENRLSICSREKRF